MLLNKNRDRTDALSNFFKNLNFANNWSDFETNKPAINANFGYNNREIE